MSGSSGAISASGVAYLLDTSILVRSLRGDAAINARIASEPLLYTSSIVLGELSYGAYGSPHEVEDLRAIDVLTARLTVLDADRGTARHYGRIKREQCVKGQMLPDNDMWIAATAIQYDLTLAARDAHFSLITGLRYEMG